MNNFGRVYNLIEVEREERSLSTLLLSGTSNCDWENTNKIILKGLVNESGKWSNEVFIILEKQGMIVKRHKHVDKNKYKKAKDIYMKVL